MSESKDKRVEFFFDYTCPYAYIASTQIEAICARNNATLAWRPMLLGGLFQAIGTPSNLSQVLIPSKVKMLLRDQKRWADLYGVELKVPRAGGYARSVDALRATLMVSEAQQAKVIHRIYRAYWVEHLDVGDHTILERLLDEAGVAGKEILNGIGDEAKAKLRANTDEAQERGAFGAPSIFYDGEMYYGQDRLPFLEQALGGALKWPGEGRYTPTPSTPKVVEFFYDPSSPFAYLASQVIESMAKKHGAKVIWRPFLLGGMFKLLGGPTIPLETFSDNKKRFTGVDLQRWAKHWDVPFVWSSHFPVRTLRAQRLAVALSQESDDGANERLGAFANACFRAVWAQDRDLEDESVLTECLQAASKGAEYLARADDPAVKQALLTATESVLSLGFFGAPGFRVGEEIFWGQDRLSQVERALEGWTLGE